MPPKSIRVLDVDSSDAESGCKYSSLFLCAYIFPFLWLKIVQDHAIRGKRLVKVESGNYAECSIKIVGVNHIVVPCTFRQSVTLFSLMDSNGDDVYSPGVSKFFDQWVASNI